MAEAFRPQSDSRVLASLARTDGKIPPAPGLTLADQRFKIYAQELGESGVLLVALLILSFTTRFPRLFVSGLLFLTLLEGLIQARHRSIDFGPIRALTSQSPVLAKLSQEPHGTPTLDPAQNLFMVAGVAPVAAYRTLDLPSPGGLIALARGPETDARVLEARKLTGVGLRVLDPMFVASLSSNVRPGAKETVEMIHDPALAGWLLGEDLARLLKANDFALLRSQNPSARAWVLAAQGLVESNLFADPFALIEKFRVASPLPYRSDRPEAAEVDVRVFNSVPSLVVLSKTFDPEWQAWWTNEAGQYREAKVVKVLGGWQGVAAPEPGRWTLHLEYPGRAVWIGLSVASTAWSFWLMGFLGAWFGKRKQVPAVISVESEPQP